MNTLNVNDELRKKITRLEYRIAELSRPPSLRIIRGEEERFRFVHRMEFEFRGFRHTTLVSDEMYGHREYKQHVIRYGIEATVRAHMEEQLEYLVTTEEWS